MTAEEAGWARHIRPLAPLPTGICPRLAPVQRCAAMLFDVYGTLLISGAGEIGNPLWGPDMLAELQAVLPRHGVEWAPRALLEALKRAIAEEHRRRGREGVDFPEIDIVRIWQAVLGGNDVERLKALAMDVELIVNPVYPMPGLQPLLVACRRRNICMGIVSNAQFYTQLLLEWFLGGPLANHGFDSRLLLFSWREGQAKPSPAMFAKARDILAAQGIHADEVLYVGNDLRNDILPAASVGFRTALFAGDRRSLRLRQDDPTYRGLVPDLVVTELHQLIGATEPPRGDQECKNT